MIYPKILSAEIDFGPHGGGNYYFRDHGVGGNPFPSESGAWAFRNGLKVLNRFMFLPYEEQQRILREMGLIK